ncbi:MAG: SDR family oxidoreductase, partial [Alphaproteobacteria bacterium]|nr:SDR family oxidoreductase [Alphaproteobacteria bacterium]
MYDLSGKIALVTGAGGEKGFGRAIANRLAKEGAGVAVNDMTANPYGKDDWGGVDAVVEEIRSGGGEAMRALADVSDAAAVDSMVDEVVSRFGRLDILVANAGSRPGRDRVPLVELTEEAFDEVQRVNVKGTFLCCRAAARHMVAREGGGRIIVIASTAGKRGVARFSAYVASKFALVGFTQSLALELGPSRITVNAICPGFAMTERMTEIADALKSEGEGLEEKLASMHRERSDSTPLGRTTEPEDVA